MIILLQILFYCCFKPCFKSVFQSLFQFMLVSSYGLIINIDTTRTILFYSYKFISRVGFTRGLLKFYQCFEKNNYQLGIQAAIYLYQVKFPLVRTITRKIKNKTHASLACLLIKYVTFYSRKEDLEGQLKSYEYESAIKAEKWTASQMLECVSLKLKTARDQFSNLTGETNSKS